MHLRHFLRSPHRLALFAILAIFFGACTPQPDIPVPDSGRADFSRVVAVGGHLLAGYQDGALYREGQEYSIPALMAQQFRQAGGSDFHQPLMPTGDGLGINVKPWQSEFQRRSKMGDRTDCEGEVSIGPVKDSLEIAEAGPEMAAVGQVKGNFSLPWASFADLDDPNTGAGYASGGNLFYDRFVTTPSTSTPLSEALAANPTFFIMWPGAQDIYNWASNGGYASALPDPVQFRADLEDYIGRLTQNGAKGVVATIPDVGHIPYFTTIPSRGLELTANTADSLNQIYGITSVDFQEGENGFVVADQNAPNGFGFRQMYADEFICLTVPLDSMKCEFLGVLFALMPDQYTLIRSELDALRARVAELNNIIVDVAAQNDIAVADMAAFYEKLNAGIVVDAVDFNSEFVSGNYFSLDGYGLSPKGAGLAANQFIDAINAHYGASVPPVRLDVLRAVLFP